MKDRLTTVCFLCFLCVLLFHSSSTSAATLTFEKDIRPILKAHCFDCHGEGEKLKGGVDLRLRRLMLAGGDNGPVIVSGKPDKSLLFTMVESGEMPRREKKLTAEQIAVIRTWISSGANVARPEPAESARAVASPMRSVRSGRSNPFAGSRCPKQSQRTGRARQSTRSSSARS